MERDDIKKLKELFEKHNNSIKKYVGCISLLGHESFIESWLINNRYLKYWDSGEIEDLLIHTSNYLMSIGTKEAARKFDDAGKLKNGKKTKKKTQKELIARNKERLSKVKEDLDYMVKTQKGSELINIINDFLENPKHYFYTTESTKITATNKELGAFLNKQGVIEEAKKEYLDYFTALK